MQWNACKVFAMPGANEAVDALFHRFGTLSCQTERAAAVRSGCQLDEPGSIEACEDDSTRVRLNRICIRRIVGTFFVLYRHMHCWGEKTLAVGQNRKEVVDCDIKLHHILAASDDFSKLSMHWDLMPSAKLNYVHDFRGLFNCISQVIYFHNPQYERRVQERKRIDEVSRGEGGIDMVQVLAPIMQLHPEILVEHEDTSSYMFPGATTTASVAKKQQWIWLVMGRIIYLCTPWDDEEQCRTVYHHENVAVLLALYRKKVLQSLACDDD